uniref:Uncharacterized protein n=1 Tax=Clytia hemisphaerica TaxID=252671 RepID=A0A7M5WUM7_9CNID
MEKDLKTKGFCIVKDIFTLEEINILKSKYDICEQEVHRICQENPSEPYDFVQLFDKETIVKMKSYCDSSIIETAKGRYDVRIQTVKDQFKALPDQNMFTEKICMRHWNFANKFTFQ